MDEHPLPLPGPDKLVSFDISFPEDGIDEDALYDEALRPTYITWTSKLELGQLCLIDGFPCKVTRISTRCMTSMGDCGSSHIYGVGLYDGIRRSLFLDNLYGCPPLIPSVVQTETETTAGTKQKLLSSRHVAKVWKHGHRQTSFHRRERSCDNPECNMCIGSCDGMWQTGKRYEGRKHIIVTIVTEGRAGGTEKVEEHISKGIKFASKHVDKMLCAPDQDQKPKQAKKKVSEKKENHRKTRKLPVKKKNSTCEDNDQAPVLQRVTSVWAIPDNVAAYDLFLANQSMLTFLGTTKCDESPSAVLGGKEIRGAFENIFSYLYVPPSKDVPSKKKANRK